MYDNNMTKSNNYYYLLIHRHASSQKISCSHTSYFWTYPSRYIAAGFKRWSQSSELKFTRRKNFNSSILIDIYLDIVNHEIPHEANWHTAKDTRGNKVNSPRMARLQGSSTRLETTTEEELSPNSSNTTKSLRRLALSKGQKLQWALRARVHQISPRMDFF